MSDPSDHHYSYSSSRGHSGVPVSDLADYRPTEVTRVDDSTLFDMPPPAMSPSTAEAATAARAVELGMDASRKSDVFLVYSNALQMQSQPGFEERAREYISIAEPLFVKWNSELGTQKARGKELNYYDSVFLQQYAEMEMRLMAASGLGVGQSSSAPMACDSSAAIGRCAAIGRTVSGGSEESATDDMADAMQMMQETEADLMDSMMEEDLMDDYMGEFTAEELTVIEEEFWRADHALDDRLDEHCAATGLCAPFDYPKGTRVCTLRRTDLTEGMPVAIYNAADAMWVLNVCFVAVAGEWLHFRYSDERLPEAMRNARLPAEPWPAIYRDPKAEVLTDTLSTGSDSMLSAAIGSLSVATPTPSASLLEKVEMDWDSITSNSDSMILAFSTTKNSLYSCIAHACAGLSYPKVALLVGPTFKFVSTPAARTNWDVSDELRSVEVGTGFHFSQFWTKDKDASEMRELSQRVCEHIAKNQCVISNDNCGHFSLLCGFKRKAQCAADSKQLRMFEDGVDTLFLMRRFVKSETARGSKASVSLASRKLFIFVGRDAATEPLPPMQLFRSCVKRAVKKNATFMEIHEKECSEKATISFSKKSSESEEKQRREEVADRIPETEGVVAFYRLSENIENGDTKLPRAIHGLMTFYDARLNIKNWLQKRVRIFANRGLEKAVKQLCLVWDSQIECINKLFGDFAHFNGTMQSLAVDSDDVDANADIRTLVDDLAEMEVEAMAQLKTMLAVDGYWHSS